MTSFETMVLKGIAIIMAILVHSKSSSGKIMKAANAWTSDLETLMKN